MKLNSCAPDVLTCMSVRADFKWQIMKTMNLGVNDSSAIQMPNFFFKFERNLRKNFYQIKDLLELNPFPK